MKKIHRDLYAAKDVPALLDVPELPCLMADGAGAPSGERYRSTVEAMYGVAYAVRAELKPTLTFSVAPLEGLWEGDPGDLTSMRWTSLIPQPEQVTAEMVERAVAAVRRKKPSARVDDIRLATLAEGRSAQILHTGPFSEEPATVGKLMKFIAEQGLSLAGRHHEIYLSNLERTAPEKVRTIIRYPVR
ncbi:GyrI-like domain-containing protein [Streptosporangium sp. NPDC051023]|uniref:GyrI-like domain-containing protein n=1 Tax=Streptosporangium sp. NPDC051023 TaxID=3155410 RepID=UPI00344C5499